MKRILFYVTIIMTSLYSAKASGQKLEIEQFKPVADSLQSYFKSRAYVAGKIAVLSVEKRGNTLHFYFNSPLSEYSFREENVEKVYSVVRSFLPEEYKNSPLFVYSHRSAIEEFIPQFFRDKSHAFAPVVMSIFVTVD